MLTCTMRRRSCANMMSTKSIWHVTVGTAKKSQAIRSWTWLCRNAFHVGEDGLRTLGRYFSTVDLATSMPSFRSSPTIRGEPHVGFDCPYLGSAYGPLARWPVVPACRSDCAVANNCGIASSARRSRSEVARMSGLLANPATDASATPRGSDRWAEALGGRRSVYRARLDGAER